MLLFRRGVAGRYVVISGRCTEAADTLIRKKTKAILIEAEEHLVRVILRQRLRRIRAGASVEIYVADSTPVYEKDGVKLLQSYLAIKITGGDRNAKGNRIAYGTKNH